MSALAAARKMESVRGCVGRTIVTNSRYGNKDDGDMNERHKLGVSRRCHQFNV